MPLVVLESEQNDRICSHHGRMNALKFEGAMARGRVMDSESFIQEVIRQLSYNTGFADFPANSP
jgi:hypothetical protein